MQIFKHIFFAFGHRERKKKSNIKEITRYKRFYIYKNKST